MIRNIKADVYLGDMRPVFGHLDGLETVRKTAGDQAKYTTCCCCLTSAVKTGSGLRASTRRRQKKTVCIDHHITNHGLAEINHVVPKASST